VSWLTRQVAIANLPPMARTLSANAILLSKTLRRSLELAIRVTRHSVLVAHGIVMAVSGGAVVVAHVFSTRS